MRILKKENARLHELLKASDDEAKKGKRESEKLVRELEKKLAKSDEVHKTYVYVLHIEREREREREMRKLLEQKLFKRRGEQTAPVT